MTEPFEQSPLPEEPQRLYGTEMCWHFALALQREAEEPAEIVALRDASGMAVHFAVRRDDNLFLDRRGAPTLVDARGAWSEADLLAEWGCTRTEAITAAEMLDEVYNDANDPDPPAPRQPGHPTTLGEQDIQDTQCVIRTWRVPDMLTDGSAPRPA